MAFGRNTAGISGGALESRVVALTHARLCSYYLLIGISTLSWMSRVVRRGLLLDNSYIPRPRIIVF